MFFFSICKNTARSRAATSGHLFIGVGRPRYWILDCGRVSFTGDPVRTSEIHGQCGNIASHRRHATFEHQGHVHVNVLGSTKVQERGSRTDVPVSSRVRTLQVEPESDDDADGSPLKPKQEDRPKVPAYAILTVRATAHFLGSPPRLPSR